MHIADVKSRINMLDMAKRDVEMKPAGSLWKGCCPFHEDRTPSFFVYPDGRWYCFGSCNTGGDIFDYYQRVHNVGFSEALEELAREAGIELERTSKQADPQRERIVATNHAAMTIFAAALQRAPTAQRYLAARGIRLHEHEGFVGYAPDTAAALLLQAGQSRAALMEAGLLSDSDWCPLSGRIIFPIHDSDGSVAGFAGRTLENNSSAAKYVNSPQSAAFDKSRLLYGFSRVQSRMRTTEAIVVEGYLDALLAFQLGHNAVAVMGTALTPLQARTLYRSTKRVVLAFDGDDAGRKATERAIKELMKMEDRPTDTLRVAVLPQGRDPHDLMLRTPDLWRQALSGSKTAVAHMIHARHHETDLDNPSDVARAVKGLRWVVDLLKSPVERDHYVDVIAKNFGVAPAAVRGEMELGPIVPREKPAHSRPDVPRHESYFLYLVAFNPTIVKWAISCGVDDSAWSTPGYKEVWRVLSSSPPTTPEELRQLTRQMEPYALGTFRIAASYYSSSISPDPGGDVDRFRPALRNLLNGRDLRHISQIHETIVALEEAGESRETLAHLLDTKNRIVAQMMKRSAEG